MKLAVIRYIVPLLFLISISSTARGGAPTDQIQSTVQDVLSTLKAALNPQAEEKRLRKIIADRFNFAEMAKRTLGPQWNRLTPQEQKQFVGLFTNLLAGNYIDRIREYSNEKVIYGDERIDGDFAEVESRIVPVQGEPISVNYRLQKTNGEWKVYDVVIENVSLVNNYRSQFNRVIANSSYEELVRRLEKQN
jgi:phospholipid transport system substrate-binding protein